MRKTLDDNRKSQWLIDKSVGDNPPPERLASKNTGGNVKRKRMAKANANATETPKRLSAQKANTNAKHQRLIQKKDWLCLGALCILAVTLLVVRRVSAKGLLLVVWVDHAVYTTMDLQKDQTLVIQTPEGRNTLLIENGVARVAESDCPRRVCQNQRIDARGGVICCAPHGVLIVPKTAALDGVSG